MLRAPVRRQCRHDSDIHSGTRKLTRRSRNLIHASDSFDAATTEIGLWFAADELSDYKVSYSLDEILLGVNEA